MCRLHGPRCSATPGNAVLAGALATMALGAVGAALARGFEELLASIVVIGLGFGGTDLSLNSLLVRASEASRAHRLSVANAGYSIGSVVGPLLVIVARPSHYPLIFAAGRALPRWHSPPALAGWAPRVRREPTRAPRHPQRRAVLGVFVRGLRPLRGDGVRCRRLDRAPAATSRLFPVNRRRRDRRVLARSGRRPIPGGAGTPARQRPAAGPRRLGGDCGTGAGRVRSMAWRLPPTRWQGSAWRSSTRWGSSGLPTSTLVTATAWRS